MKAKFLCSLALIIFVISGCTTTSYSTKKNMTVPKIVKAPSNIPPEIVPYVPRFVEILESNGFEVGKTTDPNALELKLEFNGNPFNIRVSVGLWRDGVPLVTASSTNPGWGTALARGSAVNGRADSAASAFESEMSDVKSHFIIVPDKSK